MRQKENTGEGNAGGRTIESCRAETRGIRALEASSRGGRAAEASGPPTVARPQAVTATSCGFIRGSRGCMRRLNASSRGPSTSPSLEEPHTQLESCWGVQPSRAPRASRARARAWSPGDRAASSSSRPPLLLEPPWLCCPEGGASLSPGSHCGSRPPSFSLANPDSCTGGGVSRVR